MNAAVHEMGTRPGRVEAPTMQQVVIVIKATHSDEHASNRRRTRKTRILGPQKQAQKKKREGKLKRN